MQASPCAPDSKAPRLLQYDRICRTWYCLQKYPAFMGLMCVHGRKYVVWLRSNLKHHIF